MVSGQESVDTQKKYVMKNYNNKYTENEDKKSDENNAPSWTPSFNLCKNPPKFEMIRHNPKYKFLTNHVNKRKRVFYYHSSHSFSGITRICNAT
jgi:hypothetical protein